MKRILLSAVLALLLAACAVVPEPAAAAPDAGVAKGAALLGVIQSNDYAGFARVLHPEYGARFSEKDFRTSQDAMHERFGTLRSYEYLTSLTTPAVENLIYKVTFERAAKEGGRPIVQEMLFRVVLGKIDGKPCVMGFGFF